ncbi:SDR family oxidoreductase [Ktedonobacter racemifer]|uniref:SDR family NAD(P)-dependent oxidoreductase n=1 Tax=Ktedonobacter racemifer TaxID=363277 RepID=UPI001FCACCA5
MNKAVIEALSRTLAQALGARGITVNTVTPGVIETDMGAWVYSAPGLEENIVAMIAIGRLGQLTDIADVVAFLASHDARGITAVTLDASGGTWLRPHAG